MASRLALNLGAAKYIECSTQTQQGLIDVFVETVMVATNPEVQ